MALPIVIFLGPRNAG